ncbi:MAG: PAS domain-containing protein, partial [Pseudomonadota bacterium]
MDESQDLMSNEHPRYLLRLLATIIVLLYLGAMIIIFFLSDLKTVYEPPLLLLIGNTIFAGLIPIAVSIIAARAFLFSGLNSLLFMGCGMMTFGCGAAMAGWLIDGRQVPNVNVTIMNVGALLGSAFHVVGAILALRKKPETVPERRKYNLTVAYSGMFFVVFFMTLAARGGITPLFFIQDVGPTLLRQVVLGSAVILFLLSALIIMRIFVKSKQDFHYWYALSLIMIALGLFAFFIQKSVGSPIGWMGRSGEYIGGIFALIAILFIVRSARIKGESIQSTLVGLFQDAEFNYQVLVEIITDAIVYFEQDGKIIQWNSAAEKVFGYRQSEAVGASLFDLVIDEASITIFRKEINNLSIIDDRRKVGRLLEISGKTKDRGLIPVEVSTSAMKVRDKWSFLCMFRDITERKNAEAAIQKLNDNLEQRVEERTRQLSASEQRLSLATRAGKIGIWDWEVENEKLIWDDSMYSLYGIRKEDFGGSFESWIQTLHPDDRQFVKGEIQAALRGEWEYATEFRIVQPDGAVRIINAASQTLRDRDGKALRMIGTNIDITERKQTEAALWESQQRLIFALQGGELGMWDWFLQTGKVIYNELWAQMLEYSIDEVEQSVDFFKQHLHPDDRANVLEKLMGHIEGRLPVYSSEHRLRTKSGTWIWFLDRGKVVERDEFGCAVRATGII